MRGFRHGSNMDIGGRPVVATVLQGLKVGGMERCAVELAHRAADSGYDARLILYDTPATGAEADLHAGDIPVAYLPRKSGIDTSLPRRLAKLLKEWQVDI